MRFGGRLEIRQDRFKESGLAGRKNKTKKNGKRNVRKMTLFLRDMTSDVSSRTNGVFGALATIAAGA